MQRLIARSTLALASSVLLACGAPTSGRAPVAQVTVIPSSATKGVGSTVALSATVTGPDGEILTDRAVFWASEDTSIATVSDAGVVTARRPGSVQIAASSEGPYDLATITVEAARVASVRVLPATFDATSGDRVALRAVAYDAGGKVLSGRLVLWATSNADVATVDNAGVVTARGGGTATITATIDGESGSARATVAPVRLPVASVSVAPGTASVPAGGSVQLTATPRDASGAALTGRAVNWSTSNSAIATVSSSGSVKGVSPGTATITATSEGESGRATITVTAVPVARVTVTPSSASVMVGASVQLTATVRDASDAELSGRSITWSSSNGAVAGVDAGGRVTGRLPGTATVTATSEGKSGSATITVTALPVARVTVTPERATISKGGTVQLTARAYDALGREITGRSISWSSSNTKVATVTSTGLVKAVTKRGEARITASVGGQSATATVTVRPGGHDEDDGDDS